MADKPTIQILAERLREVGGLEWRLTHTALRDYVHNLSDVDFLGEVVRVTNSRVFHILWSIGLSQKRQDICTQREKELR